MSKKTWLISMAALAAVGVFACSDEEDGGDDNNTNTDAGPLPVDGGGSLSGDGGQCINVPALGISGVTCTTADGKAGYRTCTNGVPSTAPCAALSFGGDGGTDSGISFPQIDASVFFPDGSIPDGALNALPACGTGFQCGGMGLLTGVIEGFAAAAAPGVQGVSYCSAAGDQLGLPPACNTTADCVTAGLKNGNCMDTMAAGKYCVQPCKK